VDTITFSKRIVAQISHASAVFMTSWHLWVQLHASINHPILKRIQRQYKPLHNTINILYMVVIIGVLTLSGTVILFTSVDSAIIVTMPLILILFSSSYIIPWMYRISWIIGVERHNRTLDSVSVTPAGQVAIKWMISIVTVHHKDTLGWIDLSRRIVIGIIWMLFTMALCLTITQLSDTSLSEVLNFVLNIVVFGGVIYVEHAQSILIGCLIAMWIPNKVATRLDATVSAILLYATLQILTFVAGLLLSVVIQGGLLDVNILFNQKFFTLSFIMFGLIREVLIFVLWRILAYESNASPNVIQMFD